MIDITPNTIQPDPSSVLVVIIPVDEVESFPTAIKFKNKFISNIINYYEKQLGILNDDRSVESTFN
jgi:hypothetical protein